MKKQLFFLFLPTFLVFTASCNFRKIDITDPLISHIDSTIKPGDDFFLFANGKWFKENPIPANKASNGLWQIAQDTLYSQIHNICLSCAASDNLEKGSNKQKIGDFYFSGMDSVNLNKKGISDLKNELNKIDGINDIKSVIKTAAHIHTIACKPLFSFRIGQDDKISDKNAVFILQGGLSLPNRSYYFDNDPRAVAVRNKFFDHVVNIFRLMAYNDNMAKDAAKHLMDIETAIALKSRKLEDTRNPLKNYNKISFQKLIETTPNIDWTIFIREIGLAKVDSVIIGQPEFLSALNGYIKTFSIIDWKNYLKFMLVNSLSYCLDDNTFNESFSFYSGVINGIKEPPPRWKLVVEQADYSIGELIGQTYVNEYLPKGTKEKLLEIGKAIKSVYAERINALDWMSEPTKKKALKKLNAVIMKVGYPDKWKDLSNLQIDRSSYVQNVMNANRWWFNYMISKYNKPVDRLEWGMYPQTYNAYYKNSNNEIVIPGCNIIIPGYEHKLADDAVLYSTIGITFAHEITHGFDDYGSKYDELGNLNNWWTTDDSIKFYLKTKMIVEQFNKYIAVDSLHINGKQTQGENIADLGGIVMSYEAFKKTNQYKKNIIISGLNPKQRFFLGYALFWMVNNRPEEIANMVRSDVHSPIKFRVNGPLSNMPEFYSTFGIKKGDALWRADSVRIRIW